MKANDVQESTPGFEPETKDAPDDRLARLERLERLVRLQWVLMGGLGLLIATLAALQMVSAVREGARAHAQLQLLQQIQADFGRNADPTRSVLTDQDLHRLLRDSLGQVRQAYEPLKDADLSDPNANLDAILGPTPPPREPEGETHRER